MKICLVVSQLFAWGKYGGFGVAVRNIAAGLRSQGIEVCAVTPRQTGQRPREALDGMTVLSFRKLAILGSARLYQECDADIYHSQEPTLSTYIAMKAMPERKHIITIYDPRWAADWWAFFRGYSLRRKLMFPAVYAYEANWLVTRAVHNADAVYTQADYQAPLACRRFGLDTIDAVLPTPIVVPATYPQKADSPTVCFLGRLDAIKRPERFFELAKLFPEVRFVVIGRAHDADRQRNLTAAAAELPNLEMLGFINQFVSSDIWDVLGQSWILVNASDREGLPLALLEGAAHGCALLATVNPGELASKFGYWARDGDLAAGLTYLLHDERWRTLGEAAQEYIRTTFEHDRAIQIHTDAYERALASS